MIELKPTNKFCGTCKAFFYSCDKYEGYYCSKCNCVWARKRDKKTCADCGIIILALKSNAYNDSRDKPYCMDCWSKKIKEPVNEDELNKLLDASINTPPLRLKDLKERLKKERDEKRKSTE